MRSRPSRAVELHVDGDRGTAASRASSDARSRSGSTSAATYGVTRVSHLHAAVVVGAALGRFAQRLRGGGAVELRFRDLQRAAPLLGGRGVGERRGEEAEQRRRDEREDHEGDEHLDQREARACRARPRSRARLEPPAGAMARVIASIEDRDAAGEPVDVDFVLALARARRDAAAVAAAVRDRSGSSRPCRRPGPSAR